MSEKKKPLWEIQYIRQTFDYYEGIEASDASEAIALFEMGEGEINLDRRHTPDRTLRAIRVG